MIAPNMLTGMGFITLKLQTGLLHSTFSLVDIPRRPCHESLEILISNYLHSFKLTEYLSMLLEAFGVKQSIP